MTELIDNPPPLPEPRWYVRNGCISQVPDGVPVYIAGQYLEGEAAAFARGVAAVLEKVEEIADHGIPFYAYGDNEAACDMATRLQAIRSLKQ